MSDLDFEQKPSKRLWILAAVAALALHVGGAALALANLQGDEGDDGLGSNAVEYAVEMTSPKVEDNDLRAAQEDSVAQAYAPPVQEQQAEVKETDVPKDVPMEAEDPDRIVTPNDSKKPKEEDAKVAAVETPAVAPSDAAEDMSRKALDENAPESDRAKAPSLGIGKDKQKLTADWGRKISAYFELHKRYPEKTKKETVVKVSLVLNRRGNVVSAEVVDSSGDPAFDDAAITMIHRSDPVPAPPADLTEDQFKFTLDVKFRKPK